jgi:hypothetical protein
MRYPASEKLEIIRVVEESTLPVRRTLEKIGIKTWVDDWFSFNWACNLSGHVIYRGSGLQTGSRCVVAGIV